ncbi:MAG TPA: SH3 domain-containing protein [Acidimicrobiales bacterium]|nr:SH3 domain-containing protein [Acidimicrobiales bacterium]
MTQGEPTSASGGCTIVAALVVRSSRGLGGERALKGARRALGGVFSLLALAGLVGACGGGGHKSATTTSRSTSTSLATTTTRAIPTTTGSTTTTVAVAVVNGVLTVLSPIGLNVRAGPSKTATIIATAAQGTVLQVLGRTPADGGWYKVHGATALGWMTANPAYSAAGRFGTYSSTPFKVLYPAGWVVSGAPAPGVTFRNPRGSESVVIVAGPKVSKLPTVAQGAGISEHGQQQVVACGITALLRTYNTASPGRYLADVAFSINAKHAMALKATLPSLARLRTVLDFVNSVSFPFPVCVGRPPAPTSTTQ